MPQRALLFKLRKGIGVSVAADSRVRAGGGVLDARKRLVDGEHVGDDLCSLHLQIVVAKAASEVEHGLSVAADRCQIWQV